jgi:hypothetical protein
MVDSYYSGMMGGRPLNAKRVGILAHRQVSVKGFVGFNWGKEVGRGPGERNGMGTPRLRGNVGCLASKVALSRSSAREHDWYGVAQDGEIHSQGPGSNVL